MKLFIAGIGGTLMAGIARLACQYGYRVSGCDERIYPPTSELLAQLNITPKTGYDPAHLDGDEQQILIGNALSRGNPLVEAVLNRRLPYQSAPAWLHRQVLHERSVIAVAGTHGKTTTAAMLGWILHCADRRPGYLIGGRPGNFAASAERGSGPHFVIEADEYDTAFFDKRSKFAHYAPSIAVLNNLEFDHADIFDDLKAIQTRFHHLLRLVPGNGSVVLNRDDAQLQTVVEMGCWSRLIGYSLQHRDCDWFAEAEAPDCSRFTVYRDGQAAGRVQWAHFGRHTMSNALAALAAAADCGVSVAEACAALAGFKHAERRLQRLFGDDAVLLYSDFAHHPTAIAATLEALKARHPGRNLIAGLELGSNTMRMGAHGGWVEQALGRAQHALVYCSPRRPATAGHGCFADAAQFIREIRRRQRGGDVIVLMSNGSFDGIPAQLAQQLAEDGNVPD